MATFGESTESDFGSFQSAQGVHWHDDGVDWAGSGVLEKGYLPFDENGSALEAYWPLDDDSGPLADVSGNGHNLSLTGTSQVSGVLSTDARDFDGSDDHGTTTTSLSISDSEGITAAAWLKLPDTSGDGDFGNQWFVLDDGTEAVGCVVNDTGEVFVYTSGDNTQSDAESNGTAIDDDSLHYAELVYDQPNDTVAVFLDGSQDYEVTSYTDDAPMTNPEIYVGRDLAGDNHYDGVIQHLRFYRRATTLSGHQDRYNAVF